MNTKWVFACGARRSGSTLQYQLANEVLSLNGGFNLGWTTWQNFNKSFDIYDGDHEYIIVKCHVHMPSASARCKEIWQENRGYGVFVHRNMFDTMASMLRLNSANIKSPSPNLIKEDVVAVIKEISAWIDTENVLVSRYDDIMSEDGKANECLRMAAHIGLNITSDECLDIARRHSLEKQRERLPDSGVGAYGLWAHHIATGKTGVWRNELSPEHVEFCRVASRELHARLGYEGPKYNE